MRKILMGGLVLFVAASAGCMATEGEGSQTYKARPDTAVCGGIAGFVCPEGQRCLMRDDYPDAMGVCVGARDRTVDCSAVRCAMPVCAEGFDAVPSGQGCCDYHCRRSHDDTPEVGACEVPSDCDGLVHIMCVGEWSCDTGFCSYTCAGATL